MPFSACVNQVVKRSVKNGSPHKRALEVLPKSNHKQFQRWHGQITFNFVIHLFFKTFSTSVFWNGESQLPVSGSKKMGQILFETLLGVLRARSHYPLQSPTVMWVPNILEKLVVSLVFFLSLFLGFHTHVNLLRMSCCLELSTSDIIVIQKPSTCDPI